MDKITVFLPNEMTAWVQKRVDSGDSETLSQAIRKIIKKAMEDEKQ